MILLFGKATEVNSDFLVNSSPESQQQALLNKGPQKALENIHNMLLPMTSE